MKPKTFFFAGAAALAALPLLFAVACGITGYFPPPAVLAAFGAAYLLLALTLAHFCYKNVMNPVVEMASVSRRFFGANYRLDAVVPRKGWSEAKELAGALNRMMLELQSYRAFQLTQILEEKNKAQALLDTITDGVILMDEMGVLVYSNQAALTLLGIPAMTAGVVLPAAIKNEVFAKEFSSILASKEKYVNSEIEVHLPLPAAAGGGQLSRNYGLMASKFLLATLKRQGCVVIMREITNEKELEKAKESFFHMITHDMRSPLATIQGYAEMLMRKVPQSPDTEKYFKSMLYSSRRLRGMIDDILNTTDLQRGNIVPAPEKVQANAMLARIAEQHEPVISPKKITVRIEAAPREVEFYAESALLERVLSNLLANALRSTPVNGTITLGVSEDADSVLFRVEDTGPGMAEDKRSTIFEQYDKMQKASGQGLGLGLAMCKMTVELHKGRIWVESEVGKGSKFFFTISKHLTPAPPKEVPEENA